jgi:hypothetical protein
MRAVRTHIDPAVLPDDTSPRLRILVEHSAPDLERPMLSEESEKRLDRIERETAACYADMENDTFILHREAKRLRGG